MFLDPNKLGEASPADVLEAAALGHIGLDHRFLHALLDRAPEALPAALAFTKLDRSDDSIDLSPELFALFRQWKSVEAIPFLIEYIKEDPENIPDEVLETLGAIGAPALEPLLQLYGELDEEQTGEIAFILASLRVRDERVLKLLTERLEFDVADTAFLLGIYGDPAAIPALERAQSQLAGSETELRKEISEAKESLASGTAAVPGDEAEPFDIWALYPAEADIPVDLLDEDERTELLDHSLDTVRAAAANSFFNREVTDVERQKLLTLAQNDVSASVRARAWEALMLTTEDATVVDAMLVALRNPDLPIEERKGLVVGMSAEADRNEVRAAMDELYANAEGRAKALEAMWRSMHPSFKDRFAKHLTDSDLEVRRGAVWGVGYYGIKTELDKIRKLFEDEELRSDALFAYTLALPGEVSRGRVKGMLARIEKDARGLSEMEEELVKTALDEKLMLAGKEPLFAQQAD